MRLAYNFSLVILLTSAAFASPDSDAIAAAVQRQFLAPFAKWQEERGEFSRAEMPPSGMRARALGAAQKDADGAEFTAFAVDVREVDGEWHPARFTGCVYAASDAVYVKRGGAFVAAADYFAQEPGAHPALCAPAPR